jgi:ribosomal-protein-serine acetyltransferase
VTVTAQAGLSEGVVYAGMLRDMSDGGVCVLLDRDCGLTRGMKVELAFVDGPPLCAWVCHNSHAGETSWSLGMSFAPVEIEKPEQQEDPGLSLSGESERGCRHEGSDSGVHERKYEHRVFVDADVSLQLWQESDAEEAFEILNESRSNLEQWVEWATQVHTADDLRQFIRYSVQQYQLGKTWQFAIRHRGRIVGGVGLIARPESTGEVGYWLATGYQGQGIATRCTREVIRLGFEKLGLESIEIRCAATNERSRALAGRLDFLFDAIIQRAHWTCGGMDDLMVYRISRDETGSSRKDTNRHHPGEARLSVLMEA